MDIHNYIGTATVLSDNASPEVSSFGISRYVLVTLGNFNVMMDFADRVPKASLARINYFNERLCIILYQKILVVFYRDQSIAADTAVGLDGVVMSMI